VFEFVTNSYIKMLIRRRLLAMMLDGIVFVSLQLDDVCDALLSIQFSSNGIPDELCIEGTKWRTVLVHHSVNQLINQSIKINPLDLL